MDLTFILVNWNTKDLTLGALHSVVKETKGYTYEIIVIDNGSRDGSVNAIYQAYPHVLLICNEKNEGYAQAVNQGLQKAKGEYVMLLNTDARLTPGAVEALMTFMRENPDVGIAGGQLINRDGGRQNTIAPFPSLATELLNKRLLRTFFRHRYPGKERNYTVPLDVDSLVGACIIVRRQAIEEVGLLDTDYFFFMEETDWCLRMKREGWRICFVPSAQILHLQGASASLAKTEAKIEYYRSRYRFFAKWRGKTQTYILKCSLIIRLLADLVINLPLLWVRPLRRRWERQLRILSWHLKGCPLSEGLREVDNASTN